MKGLLITYWYPPKNSIAAHRVHSFTEYLNNQSDSLDVLCPDWEGDLELQNKSRIFFSHKIKSIDIQEEEKYNKSIKGWLVKNILYKYFKYNLFRDSKPGLFYKNAVKALDKINFNEYDYILTSYNPLDSLHIGNYIKSKHPHLKWVIDYRDLYSLMEYNKLGILKGYFKKIEKKITLNADAFITVSKTLLKDQSNFLNLKSELIYNGYNNTPYKKDISFLKDTVNNNLPIISYTGSFYNGERDLSPFISYWKENKLNQKFNLIIAYPFLEDKKYLDSIKISEINNCFTYHNLNFNQSKSLQEVSEILLLVANNNKKGNGFLTGKIFEYIDSEKPILYAGYTKNYELYDLIIENQLGEHYTKFDFTNYKKISIVKPKQFSRETQAKKLQCFIKKL